ncbi:MAG: hypothetical protein H7233_00805, partial [Pseudorhodobacter sp.]|nr:hypothetical protein [Frankiaceae bacterium]
MKRSTHLTAALMSLPLVASSLGVAAAVTDLGASGVSRAAVAVCGALDLRQISAPATTPVSLTPRSIITGISAGPFTVAGGRTTLLDTASKRLRTVETTGVEGPSTYIGDVSGLAFTPDQGTVEILPPYTVVKRSSTGAEQWRKTLGQPVSTVFAYAPAAGARGGAPSGGATEVMDAATGTTTGSAAVTGRMVAQGSDGDLMATDGRYVRRYDSTLTLRQSFGSPAMENVPMPEGAPLHFYQQGSAVRLPDGRHLVADSTKGIWLFDSRGLVLDLVPAGALGGLTQQPTLVVDGGTAYYSAGPRFSSDQSLRSVPLADLLAVAVAPARQDFRLGMGAGISTGVAGNYFPAGTEAALALTMDPWWSSVSDLAITYTVRSAAETKNQLPGTSRTVPIPTTTGNAVSLPLPPTTAGAYEVDARLTSGGVPIS